MAKRVPSPAPRRKTSKAAAPKTSKTQGKTASSGSDFVLRRVYATSAMELVWNAGQKIALLVGVGIAALAFIIASIATVFDSSLWPAIIGAPIVAFLASFAFLILLALGAGFGALIYSVIASIIGGYRVTIARKGNEQSITAIGTLSVIRFVVVQSILGAIIQGLILYAEYFFGGFEIIEKGMPAVATADNWQLIAGWEILATIITTTVITAIIVSLFNRSKRNFPIRLANGAGDDCTLEYISPSENALWGFVAATASTVLMILASGSGFLPLTREVSLLTVSIWYIVMIPIAGLIGFVNAAIYNWAAQRTGKGVRGTLEPITKRG